MVSSLSDRGVRRTPLGVPAVAGGWVVLLLAMSGRYGFHRDEFYLLMSGRRLEWGFVDQPPLTPLLARVSEIVFGTSPTALRVRPALAVGSISLMAASMSRRVGGGRVAQLFSAAAVGGMGVLLGEGHLLSTAIFDFWFWTVALWIVVRLLGGADPRWWVLLGVVVGVGLLNKLTIGVLAVAIAIGVVTTGRRTLLRSGWPWLGSALAVAIPLPYFSWQADNGWPQKAMTEALRARSDGPVAYLLFQIFLLSIVLAVPAAVGWWRLARSDQLAAWRPLAVAYGAVLLAFLVNGGKAYYPAPMYPVLLAAGSLRFETLGSRARRWAAGATAAGIAVGLLIALPLLPIRSAGAMDATGELVETVGWPDLVDQVEAVVGSLPADERPDVAVFTASYGEAGAIDLLGPDRGLPPATSGHNNYWLWGPPPNHGAVVGVGRVDDVMALICDEVERVGTISNRYGVVNEEAGQPLLLCRAPTRQLADVWDEVRHYN